MIWTLNHIQAYPKSEFLEILQKHEFLKDTNLLVPRYALVYTTQNYILLFLKLNQIPIA